MFQYLWKLFEEVEMDVANCERCKSLEADLSSANADCKSKADTIAIQLETIALQDKTIIELMGEVRNLKIDLVDSKYYRDQYKRELDNLKRKQLA